MYEKEDEKCHNNKIKVKVPLLKSLYGEEVIEIGRRWLYIQNRITLSPEEEDIM